MLNKCRNDHKLNNYVGFDVFTAVTLKVAVFWDVAPYSFCVSRHFGGTYHLQSASHLLTLAPRSLLFLP
jgi:hypothetical protein